MNGSVPRSDRRALVALLLGTAAVVTAVLAARGPAIAEQSVYSWPSDEIPASSPTRTWFTPLLLARRHAETIDARVPCGDAPSLAEAGGSVVVFATARNARQRNGLAVVRSKDGLVTTVHVGSRRLARVVRSRADADCSLHVRFAEGAWAISRAGRPTLRGTVPSPPIVNGLFTALDLRAGAPLQVDVRPHAQDTRPSAWQTALRILTALLIAAAALALVPGAVAQRRIRVRPTRPRVGLQDGLVTLVIGAWWLLAPLHFDDGWVRARQLNSLVSGGYSNYYEHFGANLPLATWFEWLQHFVVAHTASLGLHRLPFVALLGGTWIVCRLCLTGLLGRGPSRGDAAWWAAALTFGVGAAAFGMMLRPEPAISLLVVGVLACCVRYARAPALGALLVAVLLCGLAVTIHPGGIVSIAPLVVCLPQIWRDGRRGTSVSLSGLAAVLPIGLAWALLLAFLDSDVSHRNDNVALIRTGVSHSGGLLNELDRYGDLNGRDGSPLRRELVVLLLLAVAALVAERFWRRRSLTERLPSASIGLALVLLAFTPSKWIWHFGGLVGLAAVAVGLETGRLASRPPSRRLSIAVGGTVTTFAVWASLGAVNEWGPLDLGRLTWYHAPVPFLVASVAALGVVLTLGRLGRLRRADLAVLPSVTGALLGATMLTMALDAVVSDGWTAPRQTLSSMVGTERSCGVADDLVVAAPGSVHVLRAIGDAQVTQDGRNGAAGGFLVSGSDPGAWYRVPTDPVGAFVRAGRASATEVVVTWGRSMHGTAPQPLETAVVTPPSLSERDRPGDWTFVALPPRPPAADAVQIFARHDDVGRSAGALTRPVSYRRSRLSALLASTRVEAAVDPFLFEAAPCAPLPRLVFGMVAAPSLLLESDWTSPPFAWPTSPFRGLDDVFDIVEVPVERLGREEERIVVHWVVPDPRDALVLSARRESPE